MSRFPEMSMNEIDIEAIIMADIKKLASFSNAHGITAENLQDHLVSPPVLKKYGILSQTDSEQWCDLWLVFEEDPVTSKGYKIVYDQETQMYGLAMRTIDDGDLFLGLYGTLEKALVSM